MGGNKNSVSSPCVEPKCSAYTAQEIATLQPRLEKKLGPEYLSSRPGPSGQKIYYLAAEKCIQLANEVFGFNGWSSQIMDCQVDFMDENPKTRTVTLGLSVVVRVTLKDGTFHEDIGYGHTENYKSKAAAFEKSKKEGTTDALKRALRNFGNVLGNCLYDLEYLKQVRKVKAFAPKWNEDDLFRHSSFVGPQKPKASPSLERANKNSTINGLGQKQTEEPKLTLIRDATEEFFEDEFGDFDEADFSVADPNCHPDEVALSDSTQSTTPNQPNTRTNNGINEQILGINPQSRSAQAQRSNGPNVQTPFYEQTNPNFGSGSAVRLDANFHDRSTHHTSVKPNLGGQNINQAGRMNSSKQISTIASPAPLHKPLSNNSLDDEALEIQSPAAGFYSARAATLIPPPAPNQSGPPAGPPEPLPPHAPPFNPHAESPSIRKTPGIDHKSSKPLTRDLKHVPSGSQAHPISGAPANGGTGTNLPRGNILNPSLDSMRRIGAPGSPSPNTRGTGFRMPMKRPTDPGILRNSNHNVNRVALDVLSANSAAIDGVDSKRQKLHG